KSGGAPRAPPASGPKLTRPHVPHLLAGDPRVPGGWPGAGASCPSGISRTFRCIAFGRTRVGDARQPLTDHRCRRIEGMTFQYRNPAVGMSLDGFRDHPLRRVRPGAVLTVAPPIRTAPVMIDCAPVMTSMMSADSATIRKPCDNKLEGSPSRVNPPGILPAAVQVSWM